MTTTVSGGACPPAGRVALQVVAAAALWNKVWTMPLQVLSLLLRTHSKALPVLVVGSPAHLQLVPEVVEVRGGLGNNTCLAENSEVGMELLDRG